MIVDHADYRIEPGKRGGLVLIITADSRRAHTLAKALGAIWSRAANAYRLSEVTARRFIVLYDCP